ncbi:Vps51/Vps67-domain-containing protein [Suillus fuscotomentosus]|uniref:Vacuolar protein sorting-associated protein 51 homolog n=1 Tax=Suillus fuscotomentosus TaxID=1912939 RepID=A0AAD4EEZ5_9AGAM|nr:Vps51/Vps67-domain-containing protein [Suillus fuscotomentosus]KAG1905019.1 Vps51/Vps67-domain-containing protein [Suillus fuscotomentosus]
MSTAQSTPTSPTAHRVKSAPRVVSSPLRPTSPQSSSTVLPSNSRRSSLGVGQTPRTKTPPGPLAKSRARDLLRKHYGLGVGPPPPIPGRSDDPMDLDSAAFDAKSYYEQLITASSLSALLKRENDLLTEIRQLDGDRQSLVYNHHHELIAASDTIAAMKTRAEGLDADLDLLKAAFSEISRLGAKVSIEEQPQHADGNSDS